MVLYYKTTHQPHRERILKKLLPALTLVAILSVPATCLIASTDKLPTTAAGASLNKNPSNTLTTHLITIKKGDTLSTLFAHHHLGYKLSHQIIHLSNAKALRNLQPNHSLELTTNTHNELVKLHYTINDIDTLIIEKANNQYTATILSKKLSKKLAFKEGIITSSLSSAAYKNHVPSKIYQQLISTFSGTINFKRNIQPGDTFRILYTNNYINNKKVSPGEIIYASLTNKNVTHQAIRYTTTGTHYYQPNGQALEPLFLSNPVKYTRISSKFSLHRMDPIQHKVQPHLGVDFAAPTGTPIHSIGDGKLVFKGWSRGYGRTVIIDYDKHYRGLYAHMSKFSNNLPHQIKKGQVIGYVGQSGWATGPHLHFGLFIKGKAVDPLKTISPKIASLPKNEIPSLKVYTQLLNQQIAQLISHKNDYKKTS